MSSVMPDTVHCIENQLDFVYVIMHKFAILWYVLKSEKYFY